MKDAIELVSDKFSVSGPTVDNSMKVTFVFGEYMQAQVAKLLTLPQQQLIKLSVSLYKRQPRFEIIEETTDTEQEITALAEELTTDIDQPIPSEQS